MLVWYVRACALVPTKVHPVSGAMVLVGSHGRSGTIKRANPECDERPRSTLPHHDSGSKTSNLDVQVPSVKFHNRPILATLASDASTAAYADVDVRRSKMHGSLRRHNICWLVANELDGSIYPGYAAMHCAAMPTIGGRIGGLADDSDRPQGLDTTKLTHRGRAKRQASIAKAGSLAAGTALWSTGN